MTKQNKAGLRLNQELKKAVLSSDEYDDFMILVQFLVKQRSLLVLRMARIVEELRSFEEMGGCIDFDEGTVTVELDTLRYTVEYRSDGSVARYTVDNPENSDAATYVHRIFFAAYIRPIYADKIRLLDEQLTNLDNDNTLKGIGEIRKSIRGDRWLTIEAVRGTSIQTEEDADPYKIFEDE